MSDRTKEEIIKDIQSIIEEHIQPVVMNDGGEIIFEDYDNGIVTVSMNGACDGCPSSSATLKMGIERTLSHFVPEVNEVVSSNMGQTFPPFMFNFR